MFGFTGVEREYYIIYAYALMSWWNFGKLIFWFSQLQGRKYQYWHDLFCYFTGLWWTITQYTCTGTRSPCGVWITHRNHNSAGTIRYSIHNPEKWEEFSHSCRCIQCICHKSNVFLLLFFQYLITSVVCTNSVELWSSTQSNFKCDMPTYCHRSLFDVKSLLALESVGSKKVDFFNVHNWPFLSCQTIS